MNRVESAGLTDTGRKRDINQDAFFLNDRAGLYIVADGMGGHKAGDVASRMVVETLRDSLTGPEKIPVSDYSDAALSTEANRLQSAIQLANRNVYKASRKHDDFRGMGTTVSAVYISGDTIIGANVGDSPIYLIHRNQINEISESHTLAAENTMSGPNGESRPDEAAHHILTRAIGVDETVTAHICEIHRFSGDILVIGSDGLSNKVSREEINAAAQSMPPPKACRHLVALANERGGEDNITVLIAKIGYTAFVNHPVSKSVIAFFRRILSVLRNN